MVMFEVEHFLGSRSGRWRKDEAEGVPQPSLPPKQHPHRNDSGPADGSAAGKGLQVKLEIRKLKSPLSINREEGPSWDTGKQILRISKWSLSGLTSATPAYIC